VAVAVLVLLPAVQTWVGGKVASELSSDLGITVRIDRIELRPFGPNRLHGVFVADLRGDTLLAADELWIRGLKVNTTGHRVRMRRIELHDTRFALAKAEGDAHSNLTNLLDKLATSDTSAGGAAWTIECGEVDIRRLHFSYHDANTPPIPFGVDLHHVDVNTADIVGSRLAMAGDSVLIDLERFALKDRSGLDLQELSGLTQLSPRGLSIEKMRLRTSRSDLRGRLQFTTTSFADYEAFETHVLMRIDLDSSKIQFADVALFAPDLQGMDIPLYVSGRFRGTVSELKGRDMDLRFGEHSHFKGAAELSGLPDLPNTFMVIDVVDFTAHQSDLAALPVPPFLKQARLQLPAEVQRLGVISFSGNFTGFTSAFTAYGRTSTELGAVSTDITYDRDTTSGFFKLRGHLATDGFELGRMLGDDAVGRIATDVNVKASGRDLASLKASIEGSVPRILAGGIDITGITLNGQLEKNLFNGHLQCTDPRAQFTFDGLADLRGRWPKVDFTADVTQLDLRAMGIIGGEGYSSVSMKVSAQGELAPDSLKGSIHLENVSYCDDSCYLVIGDLDLRNMREGGAPILELRSDLADVTVRGPFYPTRLPLAIQSVVYSVFPALQEKVIYAQEDQDFTFDLVVKNAQPLLDLVAPGLKADSGTVASGSFDSRTFDLGLSAQIPHIQYGTFSGDSVDVVMDKTLDLLIFRFRSDRQVLSAGGTYLSGITLTGKAYQDEVQLQALWTGSDEGTGGELNVNALVLNEQSVTIDIQPSKLYFGRGEWHNERTATILVDSSSIAVDSLELINGKQYILLDGTVSRDPTTALNFDLRDVDLDNAAPFYKGPALHGLLGGDGRVFDLYRHPYVLSYLCVDSLAVDEIPVGDLVVGASWNNEQNVIDLNGELRRDTLKMMGFSGVLAPGKQEELKIALLFDRFDLLFLEPYLPSAISDVQGRLSGQVDITGKLADPQMNGQAMLEDAGLRINYLNTKYTFSHPVTIRPDAFWMDGVTLHDELNGTAHASAFTINHKAFSQWNFDVAAELHSLMVLNTTYKDNERFYGRAIGSGDLYVDGYTENLGITVDAYTMSGTDIHFPLGGSADIGGIPYVRFLSSGSQADSLYAPLDLTGVHLDMKVGITPDAHFELIFDPTVGDIMSGRGRGDIAMTITPSGEFTMRGDVELTQGEYLFTLRNLVNKRFSVDPGGHITWYGDPFDAQLNINAVYKLRASLYDIMPPGERTEAFRKRVPVEVLMHLSDKLLNPQIDFQVRLPSVDEGVRTQVASILGDKDKLNRQVFGLIVANKFIPEDIGSSPGFAADARTSGATTLSEFGSSQLSNALSRLTDQLDIGVNYRPGTAIASEEWEVALGTAVFNDRVQLSTNVGVATRNASSGQGNQFLGDFSAEYLITRDGKLRFKAFSQSNDRNLNQLNQALTTQGGGLAYREDFDTLGEFFSKIGDLFRKKGHERPVE
jgi:hypothetical protein